MKKNQIIIPFIIFAILYLAFVKIDCAKAGTMGFSVEPVIFDLKIEKNQTIEKSLKIKNISNSILPLTLVLRNFSSEDSSIFDWVKIKDSYFILMPNEEKIVDFSITAPQETENMSHLLFLAVESQIEKTSNNTRALTVMAMPLLIAVFDQDKKAETNKITVEEIALLPQSRFKILEKFINKILGIKNASATNGILIADSNVLDFKIKVRNDGKYHFYPQGALQLFDKQHKLLAKTDFDGGVVLPGSSKEYNLKLNVADSSVYNFLQKNYIAMNIKSSGNKELPFWIFSGKKALFFTLAIFVFIAICFIFQMSMKKMTQLKFDFVKIESILNNFSAFSKKRFFSSSFWECGVAKVDSFFKGYPKKRNKILIKSKTIRRKKKGGEKK